MLRRIKIENLALVENLELEFDKGLTVLTGETGAGKSVIVTALGLALGDRADREFIRFRSDSASVEAVFDVSRLSPDYKKEFAEVIFDGQVRVSREFSRDGSSRVKINDHPCTLAQLKTVTEPIAEILGQHANQMLMDENNHLDFLDHFASLDSIKESVAAKYHAWRQVVDEYQQVKERRDRIVKERELLTFQKNEIEKAAVSVGEEEELTNEKRVLDSARLLMEAASNIQAILDSEENSVLTLMGTAEKELEKMAKVDSKLEARTEEVTSLIYQLQDFRNFIEQYGGSVQDDPARIEEINLRLDELYKLKKKYGGSERSILDALDEINRKLADSPPDIDSYIESLKKKSFALFDDYSQQALALSDTRKKAADYLEKLVTKELTELAIDSGGFKFEFVYQDDPEGVIMENRAVKPGPNGLETGRILFSANRGEPLKSLVKTASGGEISRVLLALKSAEKKNNKLQHSLLVFDEVDAGIGGQTAIEVGKKLKKLAADSQLLVITHLHQIAREADHHFVAEKGTDKSRRTTITVHSLTDEGKDRELARMVALPK